MAFSDDSAPWLATAVAILTGMAMSNWAVSNWHGSRKIVVIRKPKLGRTQDDLIFLECNLLIFEFGLWGYSSRQPRVGEKEYSGVRAPRLPRTLTKRQDFFSCDFVNRTHCKWISRKVKHGGSI